MNSTSPNVNRELVDPTAADQGENLLTQETGAGESKNSFPFDAMKLKVGDRLQAQPPAKVAADRCFVTLIGYVKDATMLLTAPLAPDGTRLQLLEGERLVMRVFANQNAFAFACFVERVCKVPYNYLHVSFPKEVQGTVIRKATRVRTKIIAKVHTTQPDPVETTGVISNISANGALLDGRRSMAAVGDILRLNFRFHLHSIEADLSLLAVVRAVFDDEKLKESGTSLAHFGMEFVELQANEKMLLQSMVYQQMIEHPQSVV